MNTNTTGAERRAAKADRLRARADSAREQAEELNKRGRDMASIIPFGQPILVGHHSEGRDRAYRGKIRSTLDKAIAASDKSSHYQGRAASVENSTAILSQDSDALEQLQIKIDKLQERQDLMKAFNKIAKSKTLTEADKIKKICESFNQKPEDAKILLEPDYCGRIGFASFSLTNNNATLKNAKKRLEALEEQKSAVTTEKEINGVTVTENTEAGRIQLTFDGKPDRETRIKLKSHGFKWAPSAGVWQRHLNANGKYAVKRFFDL